MMKKEEVNDWLQLGASIGVIVSLIFVGLEIRQSHQIARADVYQQRAAIFIQMMTAFVQPDRVTDAWDKLQKGQPITQQEKNQAMAIYYPAITYYENNHFQFQLGMLSEEHWQSSKNGIRGLASDQLFRDWWEDSGETFRNSFATEVDVLVSENESSE